MAKGRAKIIKRRSGIWALKAVSGIVNILPLRAVYYFADIFSRLALLFAVKQKRIALEGLAIAFGRDRSKQERKEIVRDCFAFMAKASLEIIYFIGRFEALKEKVSFEGRENLDQALAAGNGVILASAHFGNFPLMLARLALEGYATNAIIKPMRDAGAEEYFNAYRGRCGVKTIYSVPRKECVDTALRALRNNEIVFIPLDQNFGTGGVFVDFFGRKAATATGPVIMAMRTNAAILPAFMVRQPDDTHKIIFEPPMELETGSDSDQTILVNVQKITNIIERYIRRYPAEWGWVHRRWKSTPN
ncbi:MAG: lysophospholipid acyltransferase family protein [Candidatus Omnitrophica bacterium]|nr:lysophospholipid acyltransferase family protein [Candidatus Omnitrophota bacterium]